MADGDVRDRDLVLPPGAYAYVLDSTKGKVSAFVGPYKNSLSNTDQLVVWDAVGSRFRQVADTERAIQVFTTASEGQYVVLSNPADQAHVDGPPRGNSTEAVDLAIGRKQNIAGPCSFPLWPGQTAVTVDGHHLRHNQYLVARVYDAEAAREGTGAVIAPASEGVESAPAAGGEDYVLGQLIIVRGTEVSFYIPPTGIEVVPDGGGYVREAVTLERLEYCVLLDESGEKRYVQGPDVVFPSPTERFLVSGSGSRVFQAIELNPHSGVYVKVVAEYTEDGVTHPVGEELFITGDTNPIYFPRAEHTLVEYGGKVKHFAVAIPAGEGRYVLDRNSGDVKLVSGPEMFLPDPRSEVVVLRVLDPHTVDLMYPGNEEAQRINAQRSAESGRLPDGGHLLSNIAVAAAGVDEERDTLASAVASTTQSGIDTPTRHRAYAGGSTLERSTRYSGPRTIVLDTKYEGAVSVNVWPGYAVLVVDRSDHRRVVLGPKTVLLQYDETLMPLTLSTGRPKTDANQLRTAYLRVVNNQVSDRVTVETRDLVSVTIDVSYRVNFEGDDPEAWFAVEDYVKVLTDHARSRLRNAVKRLGIAEFYGSAIDVIRDTLLGEARDGGRVGLVFAENGMRLYDVEVLNVRVDDPDANHLLRGAQQDALRGAVELATAEEAAEREARLAELRLEELRREDEVAATRDAIAEDAVARRRALLVAQEEADAAKVAAQRERIVAELAIEAERLTAQIAADDQRLAVERVESELRIAELEAASNSDLVEALRVFGDRDAAARLVEAIGPAALATGVTGADLLRQVLAGTPFEPALVALTDRPLAHTNNNS